MGLELHISASIWPCIKSCIEYMRVCRTSGAPDDAKPGLNLSIVLGAACFLEGVFEASLLALLRHQREVYSRVEIPDFETRCTVGGFYNRLEEELESRVGRTVGASGYDEMFALIAGVQLNSLREVSPLWEGITTLFHFRNVIGHGRAVYARRVAIRTKQSDSGEAFDVELWEDDFSGSYRCVEEYLIKNRLLEGTFVSGLTPDLYFTDAIADHFWSLAVQVPEAISESLEGEKKAAFDAEVRSVMQDS